MAVNGRSKEKQQDEPSFSGIPGGIKSGAEDVPAHSKG